MVGIPRVTAGGQWYLRAGGAYRDSPGQPLADDIVEPVPADDDDLRLNTDHEQLNGFLTFRYQRNSGPWFSFSGSTFQAERGIAAELIGAAPRFWRYPNIKRTIAVLTGGTGDRETFLGGRGDVELSFGVDLGRTDIDAYSARDYSQVTSFEDGDDRTLTLRALADHDLGSRGDLRAAFTWAEVRHDEFLTNTPDARYRQRLISIGGETNWRLIENRGALNALRLSVGGAFDIAETPESGGREPRQERFDDWGARAGLSATFNGGNTMIHAGVSRRARFPALRELYSGALNRFAPNPDLEPENLVAMEAGVTSKLGNGEIQAVGFHHQLKDAVVRITLPAPDRRFFRVNQNELESTGGELMVTQSVGAVHLVADLTVQSVELRNTSTSQTNRPENLPEIFGSLTTRFPLVLGVTGMAEVNHIGDQFCLVPGTSEEAELDAGTQFNAEVARAFSLRPRNASWFSRIEARIAADNIADHARFDQCGLPQPGRLFRFQLRLF
jgi:iron complex outermembrane receptor protein